MFSCPSDQWTDSKVVIRPGKIAYATFPSSANSQSLTETGVGNGDKVINEFEGLGVPTAPFRQVTWSICPDGASLIFLQSYPPVHKHCRPA